MYSKKVLELFFNPKFFGKIKKPDAVGTAGNPICGDRLTFYLKIEEPVEARPRPTKIKDISYETLGCSVAISVSEVICQLIKGKTLDFASQLNYKDVLKKLGKIPPIKIHCSHLGIDALQKAIKNYKRK